MGYVASERVMSVCVVSFMARVNAPWLIRTSHVTR